MSFSNPILWHRGQNLTANSEPRKSSRRVYQTFFNWFSDHSSPGQDDVAQVRTPTPFILHWLKGRDPEDLLLPITSNSYCGHLFPASILTCLIFFFQILKDDLYRDPLRYYLTPLWEPQENGRYGSCEFSQSILPLGLEGGAGGC